jgi:hypothetical protein
MQSEPDSKDSKPGEDEKLIKRLTEVIKKYKKKKEKGKK